MDSGSDKERIARIKQQAAAAASNKARRQREDKQRSGRLYLLKVMALLPFFIFGVYSIGKNLLSSNHSRAQSASEASLEYNLAVIHRGGYLREDDPLVMSFGRALDRLQAKCPETRQQLADMSVRARDILRDNNINEPLLAVLESWRGVIPDHVQKGALGPCSDILNSYIILRVAG